MRTVTGLFDDYDDASAAVSELERAGVPSSDISVVASNADRRHGEDSDSMLLRAPARVLASARLLAALGVCWRDLG